MIVTFVTGNPNRLLRKSTIETKPEAVMHPAGEGEHDCSFVCSFSLTRGGGKETKMPIKHRGRKERGRLGKLAALLIISMAFGSISPGKLYADFAMEVLLYGWCKKKKHNLNWLSDVKRRGWLSLELARDFAEYCGCMMV